MPHDRPAATQTAPGSRPMSAMAEWAADGPELDTLGCWHDVYDPNRDLWDACAQPCAPGSTLCEQHRRLMREQARLRT